MSLLREKVLSGFLWQGLERVGSLGTQFFISIILARLLSPHEFGVISIMMVFITLCNVFIDSGFSLALIQKNEVTEQDCSAVFFINIIMAIILYMIIYVASPTIARFYQNTNICNYLRILAIVFVIRSFSLVQSTLLSKKMLFKFNFRINITAVILSGLIGITLAYLGFGVWALIFQQLVNAFITGCLLWYFVKWWPIISFSWMSLKKLYAFGWKIFISGLLNTLYSNLYSLVIGKLFNLDTLAYYNRGRHFPRLGMDTLNMVFSSVIFPGFASIQNDRVRMRTIAERGLKAVIFLTTAILCCLLVVSKQMVLILLGEKWLPCVPYMQLCCVSYLFFPLHTLNLQIITACGRSDVFLILEIIKKVQAIIIIFITYRFGVMAMVWGIVLATPVTFLENAWMNGKLISYSCWQQLWHILPYFTVGAFSGFVAVCIGYRFNNIWSSLFIRGISFASCYLFLIYVSKKIPQELSDILQDLMHRKKIY